MTQYFPNNVDGRPIAVDIDQPFASNKEAGPTITFTFPTAPGFGSGAQVSQATARAIIAGLTDALQRIANGEGPR